MRRVGTITRLTDPAPSWKLTKCKKICRNLTKLWINALKIGKVKQRNWHCQMCQKKNGHHHCLIQLPDEDIEQLFIFCWLKVVWCFVMYARQLATQNRIALIQDNLVLLHWHAGVATYLRPTRFIFVFESLQQLNLEVDYRGLCFIIKIRPNFSTKYAK